MRLLLDQGLPRSTADILRKRGWDALHVGEEGLSRAEDASILEFARQHNRTVITLDADFHALLAVSGASQPSVVRIRQEGLKGDEVAALLESVFSRVREQIEAGAVITVVTGSMRLKRLPIGQ